MRPEQLWRYAVCVAVGVLLVRLLGPDWRSGFPAAFPDSSSYVAVADRQPWSWEFWFGQRPPVYPALIWLIGPSSRAVVVAQTLLAVLAWGWLISTAWRGLRSPVVAAFAIGALALIAIQTRWMFWNTAVLTESLSITLSVAGVAGWWRWWDEPARFRLVAATSITAAWMLLRDANAVTFLVVAVPAAVVVTWMDRRRPSTRRRGLAIGLAVLALVGCYSVTAQTVSNRGETSFHNNVGLRWLSDDDMRAWMEARGMPVSDALLARRGSDAWADGEAFLRAPELAEYREWAEGEGRAAAALSFVVRADWYLDRFLDDLPALTRTNHLAYDTFGVAAHFPERPLGPFDPVGSPRAMALWTLAALAAIAVAWRWRRTTAWFLVFLAVPVASDLYLSYVADAIEVGRHLVGPMLRFAVVAVVAAAVGVDVLVERWPGGDGEIADGDARDDAIDDGTETDAVPVGATGVDRGG